MTRTVVCFNQINKPNHERTVQGLDKIERSKVNWITNCSRFRPDKVFENQPNHTNYFKQIKRSKINRTTRTVPGFGQMNVPRSTEPRGVFQVSTRQITRGVCSPHEVLQVLPGLGVWLVEWPLHLGGVEVLQLPLLALLVDVAVLHHQLVLEGVDGHALLAAAVLHQLSLEHRNYTVNHSNYLKRAAGLG